MRGAARRRLGFAFDVDGVLMRGKTALPGASSMLQRLKQESVPFAILTNNGGMLEKTRSKQLTDALGVEIRPEQVVLSHSAMRVAAEPFVDMPVLVLGSLAYMEVAQQELGFKQALTVRQLLQSNPDLSPYFKMLPDDCRLANMDPLASAVGIADIAAIFIIHDPIEWAHELQVWIFKCEGSDTLSYGFSYLRISRSAWMSCLQKHTHSKCRCSQAIAISHIVQHIHSLVLRRAPSIHACTNCTMRQHHSAQCK